MVQQHPDLTELIAKPQPTAPEKQQHILSSQKSIVGRWQRFLLPLKTKWGSEGRAADPLLGFMGYCDYLY